MEGGFENIILELPNDVDTANGFELVETNYNKPIIRIGSNYYEATLKEEEPTTDIIFDCEGNPNAINCQRYVCTLINPTDILKSDN